MKITQYDSNDSSTLKKIFLKIYLNIYAPPPQNGQIHSNNSSAGLGVFDHFVGLALKELMLNGQ